MSEMSNNYWTKGFKKTRQRQLVLSVLEQSDKPLSTREIFSKITETGDPMWLSTLYRILELFVKNSIAIKRNMFNNEMALYELNRFNHRHFAVCLSCQKIIPMSKCPMENFSPKIEETNFDIIGHNLEIFGYCNQCSPNSNQKNI